MPERKLFERLGIQPRDFVTIVDSRGQKISGRATMFNPNINAWILNTGGRYGNTTIADTSNIIKVTRGKK